MLLFTKAHNVHGDVNKLWGSMDGFCKQVWWLYL